MLLDLFSNYSEIMQKWAEAKGFAYTDHRQESILKRLEENPGKHFLWTKQYINFIGWKYDGPYIEGVVGNRKIWIYKIVGKAAFETSKVYMGWCVELQTCQIPTSIMLQEQGTVPGIRVGGDSMDVESNAFEQKYRILKKGVDDFHLRDGSQVDLQLLDPNMIAVIQSSNFSIIEFSDSSVAVMQLRPPKDEEVLEKTLALGIQIAQQVDRNFPVRSPHTVIAGK